jgi:D-3-phosphoglycerate dehydrogenase
MREVVLITDCDMGEPEIERRVVEEAGYRLALGDCATEDDVIATATRTRANALLVQYAPVTRRVFERCPAVRAVGRYGVGVDTVDLVAAADRGVHVVNVPEYGTAEVADHALTLLLALVRNLTFWTSETTSRRWPQPLTEQPPPELAALTLGLLGFGSIARAVATRARAFGMAILAHDPFVEGAELAAGNVEPVTWRQLWERSDAVSLHAPLSDATRASVDDAALGRMRHGSFLVNTARAGLVDRDALRCALEEGRLRGAALDVWWEEPPEAGDALLGHPRLLVTPHVAWLSRGSIGRLRRRAAEHVVAALVGQPVGSVIR